MIKTLLHFDSIDGQMNYDPILKTNNAYNTFGLLQNKSVGVFYIQVVRNEIILYFKLVKIK